MQIATCQEPIGLGTASAELRQEISNYLSVAELCAERATCRGKSSTEAFVGHLVQLQLQGPAVFSAAAESYINKNAVELAQCEQLYARDDFRVYAGLQ
ncbi:unnamed protein product, partial [Durusdinium trenchii]